MRTHQTERSPVTLLITIVGMLAVAVAFVIALIHSPGPVDARAVGSDPAPAAAADFPPLPQPVTSFGAAVLDDHLYIVGGHSGDPHQYSKATLADSFRRIDLREPEKWEALPETRKLQGLAAVAHGKHVYRIGGLEPRNAEDKPGDLHSVADVARYNVKTQQWEDCTSLPETRSSHDAVVVGDELIVIGGWSMSGSGVEGKWLTTVWSANLTQWPLQWKPLTDAPFERRAMSVAAARGKLVVIGGLEPKGGTSAAVGILDLATGQWSKGADSPGTDRMKAFGSSAFAIGDTIYASGWSTPLLAYDVASDKWKELDIKLDHPRFFHRLVAHGNDTLIMIGGASKSGPLTDVQIINVP